MNIITGSSKSGKSALVPIVDYCLGAGTCAVAHGAIRSTVTWYGLRLAVGAKQVFMAYRRSESEMPAFRFEYKHAQLEGIEFLWQTQPTRILSDGLECVRTALGQPDASGRRSPIAVEGSHFALLCDMVIPALGQSRLQELMAAVPEVQFTNGCVSIDRATGATGHPRYFAGGDCVNGGREVVDAVADGKRAAAGIAQSLEARHG